MVLDEDGAQVSCENGTIRILPTYAAVEKVSVGSLDLEFVVKEITESEEFEAYEALTQFHYRGRSLFGRTARLVVRNFHPIYPKVIGYIELTTPFYMNKARGTLLNAPFKANGVAWDRWDTEVQRRYIHLNVRIARCVVYPEFRGLGIGQLLVKHAAMFARDRWQVSRLKPYFMEISADMLKYVPFVERCGMTFIGETEGNLKRVAKDLSYLLRNAERIRAGEIVRHGVFGMLDKQVTRMSKAVALMDEMGWTLDELMERLEKSFESKTLRDFDLLHEILSLPKPTYLQGLTPEAEDFVQSRVADIAPRNGHAPSSLRSEPLSGPVKLKDVSIAYSSRVRRTWQTHDIQQAFGISPAGISHNVLHDLSLELNPGEVILLTGPSGAGKTTVLRLLAEKIAEGVTGSISLPDNYRPGVFRDIRSKKFYACTLDHPQRMFVGIIPHNKTIFNATLELIESYHRETQSLRGLGLGEANPYGGQLQPGTDRWRELVDLYLTSLTYFSVGRILNSIRTDLGSDVNRNLERDGLGALEIRELTGSTSTDEVTDILEHLEQPARDDAKESDAVLATSMVSHGVDIDRLNAMIFYGMPRQTAEYIQASSRVGRANVGVVFSCLHPIRERDQSHYGYFIKYHEYMGQLVEPVAINRWAKYSIQRTLPGLFMGVLLQLLANKDIGNANKYYIKEFVQQKISTGEITAEDFVPVLERAYQVDEDDTVGETDFRKEIRRMVARFLDQILAPSYDGTFVSESLRPHKPMMSLRDVDEPVNIELDSRGSRWASRSGER